MSFNRRLFLQKLSILSTAMTVQNLLPKALAESLEEAKKRIEGMSPEACAKDEDFWYQVQQAYTVSPTLINLNNAGVSPQPLVVQEAVERYNKLSNEAPSYYMWRILDIGKEPLRESLARMAGCDSEEIAINRNATEGLETVVSGLRLERGDEVILSHQDYSTVVNAWKQRAHRDGIVLKWVDFDVPEEDKQRIVAKYKEAFTAKTRVVHLTHMINWTGQILPVKEIASFAQDRGVSVLVDGAHTFAQLDFQIPDLNCDYFATSLHKWLSAPFGSGMLYVRKNKIKDLYPLFAAPEPEENNIRKFENLGTRSLAIEQAIAQAINFHEYIGAPRKEQRLFYLKNYWAEKARNIPGLRLHTSLKPGYSGAIALFSIEGLTATEVVNFLFQKPYRIHTTAIKLENIKGLRVTPNVYTLTKDLDRLLVAIRACANSRDQQSTKKE